MSNAYPMVSLSEIAEAISRPVSVTAGKSYRTIGVKWWGEGAYERETIDGSRTAARMLSLVREGDLIINKIWVRHGSTAIATKAVDGCAASGEFPTFKLNQNRVVPRWIHWQTKTPDFWTKCDALSRGTSGKNRIKPELFLTIKIPLPPLEVQRRIVARIEELSAKIEEARTLREQGIEEAGAFFENSLAKTFGKMFAAYPAVTFGAVCDVVRGGSPRPAGSPVYYNGNIPFLKVADLTRDEAKYLTRHSFTIKEAGLTKTRRVEPNTLLLTNSGATLGVPKIVSFETCFNDGIQAFLNLPDDLSKEYLYYFFRSKTQFFREWVARGQGQPNLNTDMVKTMRFPRPPSNEQRRIVAELDALHAKVDALKRLQAETAAELDALMPSILSRAFAGEL
jgi:type I restriction enzyme S subunit